MKKIIIQLENEKAMYDVRDKVHEQLVGNKDYIDSNIVLNCSDDRNDGTKNEVHVYIFDECINVPSISI